MIPYYNCITTSSAGGVQLAPYLHGVCVVGRVGHPQAKIVRVVHISDTRGNHIDFTDIPMGHILIHSGDFDKYRFNKHFHKERKRDRQLARMNHFFQRQPHPYKIFVSGNEDFTLDSLSAHEIQERLPNAIYLQDTSCTLFGLTIYGSPWNLPKRKSLARGFSCGHRQLDRLWKTIPEETDILITHMAPWESEVFYHEVAHRIRPVVHLFGDDQAGPGIKWKEQILFSNGAMHGAYVSSHGSHHDNSFSSYRRNGGGFFSFRGNRRPPQPHRYVNMHSDSNNHDSRPHPIVIDIYVVSDNLDYVRLPRYVSPPPRTETAPTSSSGSSSSNTCRNNRRNSLNTSGRLSHRDLLLCPMKDREQDDKTIQNTPRNSLETSRRLIASDSILVRLSRDEEDVDKAMNNLPHSSSLPHPHNSSFAASHSLSSLRWNAGCCIS